MLSHGNSSYDLSEACELKMIYMAQDIQRTPSSLDWEKNK